MSQAEGNNPDMYCGLLLSQEFEEVRDETPLFPFGKIPQIATGGCFGKPCAI